MCQHLCVTDRWEVEDNVQKFWLTTVCSGLELRFGGKGPYLPSSLAGPVVILKLHTPARPVDTSLQPQLLERLIQTFRTYLRTVGHLASMYVDPDSISSTA